jgi:hypothetical protein
MAFKEGDRIRVNLTGNDYRIMWVGDRLAVLETEDKSHQLLTTMDHLGVDSSVKEFKNTEKMMGSR